MKPLLIALTLTSALGAAPLQRVAYDDAGNPQEQAHLVTGADWKFENPGEATAAARTCAFGTTVEFGYAGLQPKAAYAAKLRFFADETRTMRLKAGDAVIAESITAEKGRTTEQTLVIPPTAYQNGRLSLILERLTGPNAVVSEVEILSDNPPRLTELPEPVFEIPTLTPRPSSVAGCQAIAVDLAGTWKFNPAPPADFKSQISNLKSQIPAGWSDIQVPGEWAMQGFEVKPGTAAAYYRTFTVPADWSGKRIKLRCDGVYSDAVVWVNGQQVGQHSGGFTPFELDLTNNAKPGGDNTLVITALNESVADKLASGSQYACHQLGGIPRGIRLMVLPETHFTSLQVITKFDATFRDATLELDAAVAGGPAEVLVSLARIGSDRSDGSDLSDLRVKPGKGSIPVTAPAKWDPEYPNLYTLTLKLEVAGKIVENLTNRIGFRQIEVRGNELLVNGLPVKLRGSNHHEVYPTAGRAVPTGIHRQDIELFREGNVNLLRTCHYPPNEDLMTAADELGMFIECEAPFCWAPADGHRELVCQQTAEMVLTYRNHPSVLWWSLANESGWGPHFTASSKLVRKLDSSRPQIFNDNGSTSDPKFTDLINFHYPGHGGPANARKGRAQPVYLGEDCHLNAYNRLELATDPAVRDLWGRYLREVWDDIYQTKGALGQSIWSGVDDTFYLNDDRTVGYGTWGPIDGWRRKKPEWWNMKKAYSPVRISELTHTPDAITLAVENRQNFANLNEMKITWKLGELSGTAAADIAPGAKGSLAIKPGREAKPGERLDLTFTDPRGFVADQFRPVVIPAPEATPPAKDGRKSRDDTNWRYNMKTGELSQAGSLKMTGPRLMLLPLNNTGETQMTGKTKVWSPFTDSCANWTSILVPRTANDTSNAPAVIVKCDGAQGGYDMVFDRDGVNIFYEFTITKAVNPRQVGLVFTLPRDCEIFSWERQGYWDNYPDDHIARLKGTVKASEGFEATSVGPRTAPTHPWRLDNLPYGNNDFCSTKHNVLTASLTNAQGQGLIIDGRGKQHVRCWRTEQGVHVIIADYSNAGSERFLRGLTAKDDRPLKPGDKITGTVSLRTR